MGFLGFFLVLFLRFIYFIGGLCLCLVMNRCRYLVGGRECYRKFGNGVYLRRSRGLGYFGLCGRVCRLFGY